MLNEYNEYKMTIYRLDPLQDPRWMDLLRHHPATSMFHTPGWLDALRRTYRYVPVAFTTSPPNAELRNGVVYCQIKSWATGTRLVSLPFSDHCQPLVEDVLELQLILEYLQRHAREHGCKYVELRPLSDDLLANGSYFSRSATYGFHKIDLRPPLESIYRGFHDSCVRRKIRKGERELTYEAGRSETLVKKFRHLLLLTRRRHQIPPQPLAWFRNLIDCLGNDLTIHVVSSGTDPVASIITLAYNKTLIYKYGASDAKFHNLGGTSLLFWKAIQEGKRLGAEEFDLGRSELDDPGLSAFKEHLGGIGSKLNYYRYPASPRLKSVSGPVLPYLRQAFAHMPDAIFSGVGQLLYRHMG